MKRAAFYTLGCKVNFAETEALQTLFERAGYRIVPFSEPAEVFIINTCTVTALGDHKSRKMIRRARRHNPRGIIVVTGCYAQGFPEQVKKIPGVDLVIGTHGREELPRLVEKLSQSCPLDLVEPFPEEASFEILPLFRQRGRTRGFLKIQEGCTMSCSYCLIPRVRGPLRSLPLPEAVARARRMARSGYREIVLTGIHLGLYGTDLGDGEATLAGLLAELDQIPKLHRVRLSSLEPTDITGELIEQILTSSKVCPHLHIPLQSGDEQILERMNRLYTPAEFKYLINWLRQLKPDLAISSDIIVGFPGETDQHHLRSLEFVRQIKFSRLHVFKYSPRPGTPAADLPEQVPAKVKDRRSREMITLGEEMAKAYRSIFIGSTEEVLIEEVGSLQPNISPIQREGGQPSLPDNRGGGRLSLPDNRRGGRLCPPANRGGDVYYGEGFTPHYIRVKTTLPGKGSYWQGKLIPVRLEREEDSILTGAPNGRQEAGNRKQEGRSTCRKNPKPTV